MSLWERQRRLSICLSVCLPISALSFPLTRACPPIVLVSLLVQALGFKMGVFHVESKYTTRGPRLIEVNCRMGGGPVRDTNLLVGCRGVECVGSCCFVWVVWVVWVGRVGKRGGMFDGWRL